ncbi:hypothetical protein D3C81_787500 [compost metagenome]
MKVPPNESFLMNSTINNLTEEEIWRSEDTYVARGAYMYCTMGTHEDVLNQTENHGVYINGHSMMTVADCVVSTSEAIHGVVEFDSPGNKIDGNIYSFGFCRSLRHPLKVAEQSGTYIDSSYIHDVDPKTGKQKFGELIFPCVPKLDPIPMDTSNGNFTLGTRWSGGSSNVSIQGVPALTSSSCLYCRWGGTIKFLTNGMDPAPYEIIPGGVK